MRTNMKSLGEISAKILQYSVIIVIMEGPNIVQTYNVRYLWSSWMTGRNSSKVVLFLPF